MDKHQEILKRLCRLCGGRCLSSAETKAGKCAKSCANYVDKIASTFHVDVSYDDKSTHPPYMCHSCYTFLFLSTRKTAPAWPSHQRTGICTVCTNSALQLTAGRKKKQKQHPGSGRPRITPAYLEHFSSLPSSSTVSRDKIHNFEPLSSTAHIDCKICTRLLDNALETPCMHLFCSECLTAHYESSGLSSAPCPSCQAPVHFKSITVPRGYFAGLFLSMAMKCKACKVHVTVGEISSHVCSITNPNSVSLVGKHHISPAPPPPSEVTKMLLRPLTAPLTPQMEALGSHILKTKLAQSADGLTMKYSTGGRSLTTLCVPIPLKSSGVASSTAIRRRSEILDKTRSLLSKGATQEQHQDELKLCNLRDNLQGMLRDLNLDVIRIPNMQLLAAKAHLGISWTRLRELKRWLKKYHILTEGEKAMRQQQHDVVADNIIAENLPFSFPDEVNGGVIIKPAPCVGVKSLVAKVIQQLDAYEKTQELTWHEGNIPHDEVWVKVGGDKGGGTFKQMFQIANVERPNALRHTVVACAFAAGDTSNNLKTGLLRFCQQVAELQSCTWKSHNTRLFMFGDYEYLCRVYGITGASGRHCCLFCDIPKDDMRMPREERATFRQRTLQTLDDDLQRFNADGSKLSKAKLFNNVINEPMFRIPLTQVCPPGLHISLGLYLKHFNSFEGACHDLDMQVAAVLALKDEHHTEGEHPVLGLSFKNIVSVLKRARQLDLQAEALDEEFRQKEEELADAIMTSMEGSADIRTYVDETTALRKQQEHLLAEAKALREKAALKPGQGPLAGQLDITLQEFRVQRQAYHGKSFVGNHVHKCCKEDNIQLLTNAVVNKTRDLCPSLVPEARTVAAKYAKLFHLFGTCHRKYNTSSVLDGPAVDALSQDIKNYLAYFRASFPSETVPPKMHLLEDHVIPWLRQWHFGLGFHGEQGGESVHAHLNTLRRDVRGLHEEVDILRSVIRTHWVMTSPAHSPSAAFMYWQ